MITLLPVSEPFTAKDISRVFLIHLRKCRLIREFNELVDLGLIPEAKAKDREITAVQAELDALPRELYEAAIEPWMDRRDQKTEAA